MSLRQKILITILSFILIYSVYFWGIPSIINVQKNIDKIEDIVYKQSGFKINITNPNIKMGLLPSIWLKADDFSILNKDNSPALKINNPNIEISFLKFIIGKCHITYFSADKIETNLIYNKDSNIYLGDYLLPKTQSSALDINHIKLNIQNYNINFDDKTTNQKVILKGDYFTISKFVNNKRYALSGDFDIKLNNKKSDVNFDINLKLPLTKNLSKKSNYVNATVTNLDLSMLSKYVSYFTNNQYTDLKGILNFETHTSNKNSDDKCYLTSFILEKFGVNGKDFKLPYYYKDKIYYTSALVAKNNDLYIDNLKFRAKDINVDILGVINKITSNNQFLNLQVKSNNSKAEGLVALIPANNKLLRNQKLDFDFETLVKAGFFADVNFDLKVEGNVDNPDVFGDLFITNAYVTKTPISNGAKKATINLKFNKDKIYLDNVHVPASPTQYVDVRGWVEMYGKKNVDLHITSTDSVDLGIAQYVLMPVHRVLGFELGPVPIMEVYGLGNIDLKVKGNKGDPHTFGAFNFKNGTVSFNDVKNMVIKNASGTLKFLDTNTQFITKSATLNGKPITVNGTCSLQGVLDFKANTEKQNINDLLHILKSSPMLKDIAVMVKQINTKSGLSDFNLHLTGKVLNANDIKFGENIFADGSLNLYKVSAQLEGLNIPLTNLTGKIAFNNTDLDMNLESVINRSKIIIKGFVKDNKSNLNISSDNMYADDLVYNFSNGKIIPINKNASNRRGFIIFSANYTGGIDKIDFSKLKVNGSATFSNYKCIYAPYKMPIEISNANGNIKNSVLNIYGVNLKISNMPIFVKGSVSDIYRNPNMNLFIQTKPNQAFADGLFNRKSIYPIKIKGKISNTIFITGTLDNYNLKSTAIIDPNSKIYYMGATIGDEINSVVIDIDSNVRKNAIYIKSLTYDKIMRTNKNRYYPTRELVVSGGIKYLKNDILFDNFRIKTLTPTDSRFFNIIFKKPYIKQGQFNSNILVNGSLYNLKILGNLNINNISIPNYTLNLDKISMNFQNKNINLNANGSMFSKPFRLKSTMNNNLKVPYTVNDLKLDISEIDLNEVSNTAKRIEMESQEKLVISNVAPFSFDFGSIVINNAQLTSKSITLDNIKLYDLIAKASYSKNKVFNMKEFQFKTAQGKISGVYSINLNNNRHNVSVEISDIDAKMFTETLFNLRNQISGNLNGKMEVVCTGLTQENCLKTLSGNGGFSISNGKMPKLGSLEYLLNAANIVKGGVTGLSINNLINLITPLRTGIFDSITGSISVKNGICNDIQIFSQSKNLNLFIKGKYNLTSSEAQMKIFGRLARNTSNILGPVGNASLNALFNTIPMVDLSKNTDNSLLEYINKIPAIELNSKKYRIFTVDINGNINGNDYVKSFNWVE